MGRRRLRSGRRRHRPGRNPHEAVVAFLEPLKDALAVLDGYAKILVHRRGAYRKDVPYLWILNGEDGMDLRGVGRQRATMQFQVVDCDPTRNEERHPLRVTTPGYNYKISNIADEDLIRFHWHPRGAGASQHPHVHALPDLRLPVYMPRVTLEAVIRTCVEMGAPLTVAADEAIKHLALTEAPHMLYRSWSDWPPGHGAPYGTRGGPPPRQHQ